MGGSNGLSKSGGGTKVLKPEGFGVATFWVHQQAVGIGRQVELPLRRNDHALYELRSGIDLCWMPEL
jgi:hypothetical protein